MAAAVKKTGTRLVDGLRNFAGRIGRPISGTSTTFTAADRFNIQRLPDPLEKRLPGGFVISPKGWRGTAPRVVPTDRMALENATLLPACRKPLLTPELYFRCHRYFGRPLYPVRARSRPSGVYEPPAWGFYFDNRGASITAEQ
jgi:hypothetical protein